MRLDAHSAVVLPDPPPLVEAVTRLCVSMRSGEDAYLVGGAVRDILAGRQISDVDIAVSGDTMVFGEGLVSTFGGDLVLMDSRRGIVRTVLESPRAVIDIAPLGGVIEEDLSHRDFTIDAMALPLAWSLLDGTGTIIDPYEGYEDLQNGIIRALSDEIFIDDPLRLMRAPRLAAQLGFVISSHTSSLIRAHARLIESVSCERVRDEFLKLLAEHNVTKSLRLLDQLGLLCMVVPELAEARGVRQPKEHQWPVLEHCIETAGQVEQVVQNTVDGLGGFVTELVPRFEHMKEYFDQDVGDGHSKCTILKLAGLLHDVGKPATKTVDSTGRMRFLGHSETGAGMTESVLERLRMSRRIVDAVTKMVKYHLRPGQMAQEGELPTRRALYRYYRDVGDVAIDTLYLNMADYLAARGDMLNRQEWEDYCRTSEHILNGFETQDLEGQRRLIDGRDIMKVFGVDAGPPIGVLLGMVDEAQAIGQVSTREEALSLVGNTLRAGGASA